MKRFRFEIFSFVLVAGLLGYMYYPREPRPNGTAFSSCGTGKKVGPNHVKKSKDNCVDTEELKAE
jgi:hypothetical protein